MSSTCLEEFGENDSLVTRAKPTSPHQRRAHSGGLRAGASPEKRTDGDQECPNPCSRDYGPVDCKTLSVRRRLAEELGCCGCTDKPETPCLVSEDTSTCCVQRRPATSNRRRPEPDACCAASVDPVEQIINEGLQQRQKKRHSRRQSSCGDRPLRPSGRERRGRPPAADHRGGYQPDYFDDQADMSNWQEHRERSRRGDARQRPSSPPPRPKSLAFEPYVDNEPYSPAAASVAPTVGQAARPPQDENQDFQQQMLLELERLDEQRAQLLQSMERERKVIEMVLEHKRQKRACPTAATTELSDDDRQRIQRRINEAKRKTAELQRRFQRPSEQQCSSPSSPRNRTPIGTAAATETSTPCKRRKLRYQPPSPDTETEDECRAPPPPPPRRRLLKYCPPSDSGSSNDGCENAAAAADDDRQSSLQDSFTYYNRSVRNGVPPVTADVPQHTSTSSPWSSR